MCMAWALYFRVKQLAFIWKWRYVITCTLQVFDYIYVMMCISNYLILSEEIEASFLEKCRHIYKKMNTKKISTTYFLIYAVFTCANKTHRKNILHTCGKRAWVILYTYSKLKNISLASTFVSKIVKIWFHIAKHFNSLKDLTDKRSSKTYFMWNVFNIVRPWKHSG